MNTASVWGLCMGSSSSGPDQGGEEHCCGLSGTLAIGETDPLLNNLKKYLKTRFQWTAVSSVSIC